MLTRLLYLTTGWFLLSFIMVVLRGAAVRRTRTLNSLAWLGTVILCGDLWALLTFGVPSEIAIWSGVAFLFGWWWIRRLPNWNGLGQALWAFSVLCTLLFLVYSLAVTVLTPLNPLALLGGLLLFAIEFVALGLALTYMYESLDVTCRVSWSRRVNQIAPAADYAPKVSLHVPTYNEPPEVVKKTLRKLAELDYPNFEVLLVDNNTPNETSWRPLEVLCHQLGDHFRFLHLHDWPGYKSGALNFALTQTALDAEIIGVVDADYLVSADFLRDLTPFFADPQIAFIQTPQDYREYSGNAFLRASYYAYKYFFEVSMPSRNEHNAIIFGGTMGLIRKSVLQEIGGWDEWCITEDAEASLRILKRGYQSLFINRTYGWGLMPFTFEGLKKQRFRWCFGGIQILKKHWKSLMPWSHWVESDNELSGAQRYYYLVGGLQWFNDLLNFCFAIFLLLGGLINLIPVGVYLRPLTIPLLVMPTIFLLIGLWRFLWVLKNMLSLSWKNALLAMTNFFGLGWAVTLGVFQGLTQQEGVFLRTPKTRGRSGLVRAIRAAQWETGIGVGLVLLGVLLIFYKPRTNVIFFALLVWQALYYLSAPFYSIISLRPQELPLLTSRADIFARSVDEQWAARWAVALVLLLFVIIGLIQFLPMPAVEPEYASLAPIEIPGRQIIGLEFVPFDQRDDELRLFTSTPVLTSTSVLETPLSKTSTPSLSQDTSTPSPVTQPSSTPTTPMPPTPPVPTQTPTLTPTNPPPTPSPTPTNSVSPTSPIPTLTQIPTSPAPTKPPLPTTPVPPTVPVPTQTQIPTSPAPTQSPTLTGSVSPTSPVPTGTQIPTSPVPTLPGPL